jgi:DHA3 family macrolide efflux protein-like MFS transporter
MHKGAATSVTMRPFLTVWVGQAFSLLGSQLVQFALVWWLTRTTGAATMLALASLAALRRFAASSV